MAGRSEKDSLGKFSKKHNKYGSTSQSNDTNETFLKHHVASGETLQGIALKYGLSMEEIKRANNIWTNDSLFLRDYLLIPLSKSPMKVSVPFANGSSSNADNSSPSDCEIITKQELKAAKMSRTNSCKSQESISENLQTDLSARDFLSRFDSSLAQIRTSVKSLEESSSIPQDDSNPLSFLPPKKSSRYISRIRSRSSESDDSVGEPSLVIKSKGATRKIRSSLEQLENAQDELFKL